MNDPDAEYTLWCGNISDRMTEEILYELFLQAGPLQEVKIPKDRDNRQQNYAFITFKHIASVAYAIQIFENTYLFDRPLLMQPRHQIQRQQQHSPQHYHQQPPRFMMPRPPMNRMPQHNAPPIPDEFASEDPNLFRNPNNMYINQNYNQCNSPKYTNNYHNSSVSRKREDRREQPYHKNRHSHKSNNRRSRR